MRSNHGPGALAIDIQIPNMELTFDEFDLVAGVGINRSGQSILGVVRNRQRFLEVLCLDHRQHRAEYLFLRNPRIRRNVGDHRWLDVVSVAMLSRAPTTSDYSSFLLSNL